MDAPREYQYAEGWASAGVILGVCLVSAGLITTTYLCLIPLWGQATDAATPLDVAGVCSAAVGVGFGVAGLRGLFGCVQLARARRVRLTLHEGRIIDTRAAARAQIDLSDVRHIGLSGGTGHRPTELTFTTANHALTVPMTLGGWPGLVVDVLDAHPQIELRIDPPLRQRLEALRSGRGASLEVPIAEPIELHTSVRVRAAASLIAPFWGGLVATLLVHTVGGGTALSAGFAVCSLLICAAELTKAVSASREAVAVTTAGLTPLGDEAATSVPWRHVVAYTVHGWPMGARIRLHTTERTWVIDCSRRLANRAGPALDRALDLLDQTLEEQ